MPRWQSKQRGIMAPEQGLHQPYSDGGYQAPAVILPTREKPSVVPRSEGFLAHDSIMVDPYAVQTRGTTNGYTEGHRDVRRARGHAHSGIYLDQVAPRLHEQRASHDGPVGRTGAILKERDAQGRQVAETSSDFYYGSSHPVPKRNTKEPRRMHERFMAKVEKYDRRDKDLDIEIDLGRAHATQIEEDAYRRAERRNEAMGHRVDAEKYDPWSVDGGERDPVRHGGITGEAQMDHGRSWEIPLMQMRRNDNGVGDDPYRDMGGKRVVLEDRGIGLLRPEQPGPAENGASFANKWYGGAEPEAKRADFRRCRDIDAPTNALSQAEMVRVRYKHEKEGQRAPIEGTRRMHTMETHAHYTDTGATGPPVIAGGEMGHKQQARRVRDMDSMHTFDPDPQAHIDEYAGHVADRDHRMLRPVEFDGSVEVSANSPDVRAHMFAQGRPHQRWN